ncbi:hypothetical protein FRC02_007130 [Tulasnella sp. 418]|nr:hypothetical protein FRC02_007130 [Tulasnella sp. 418]
MLITKVLPTSLALIALLPAVLGRPKHDPNDDLYHLKVTVDNNPNWIMYLNPSGSDDHYLNLALVDRPRGIFKTDESGRYTQVRLDEKDSWQIVCTKPITGTPDRGDYLAYSGSDCTPFADFETVNWPGVLFNCDRSDQVRYTKDLEVIATLGANPSCHQFEVSREKVALSEPMLKSDLDDDQYYLISRHLDGQSKYLSVFWPPAVPSNNNNKSGRMYIGALMTAEGQGRPEIFRISASGVSSRGPKSPNAWATLCAPESGEGGELGQRYGRIRFLASHNYCYPWKSFATGEEHGTFYDCHGTIYYTEVPYQHRYITQMGGICVQTQILRRRYHGPPGMEKNGKRNLVIA